MWKMGWLPSFKGNRDFFPKYFYKLMVSNAFGVFESIIVITVIDIPVVSRDPSHCTGSACCFLQLLKTLSCDHALVYSPSPLGEHLCSFQPFAVKNSAATNTLYGRL